MGMLPNAAVLFAGGFSYRDLLPRMGLLVRAVSKRFLFSSIFQLTRIRVSPILNFRLLNFLLLPYNLWSNMTLASNHGFLPLCGAAMSLFEFPYLAVGSHWFPA